MKVLIYTHEFPPFSGGLATTSYKLANGIREAGLEVTVLAPGYSAQDKEPDNGFNFRVVRMRGFARNHGIPSPMKEAVGFFSLTKVLSQIKPDVVLFVTREAHVAGGLLPNLPFKAVIRVAGYEAIRYLLGRRLNRRFFGLPMKRLYMKAYKIISPSQSTKELLEKARIPGDKIEVIYNGVNKCMLSQEPNPRALEELKGQDAAIKALLIFWIYLKMRKKPWPSEEGEGKKFKTFLQKIGW